MCTAHLPTIGGSVATTRHQYWWTYTLLLTYTSLYPTPGPIALPPGPISYPPSDLYPTFPGPISYPLPDLYPLYPTFPLDRNPTPGLIPYPFSGPIPYPSLTESLTDSCKTLPSRNYCCGRLISDTFEIICFLSFKTNKAAMDSTN